MSLNFREDANRLLASIGELTGTAGLAFNSNNECSITINDKVVLILTLDEDDLHSIVITGVVGMLPQTDALTPIMYALLCGNYAWGQTEGGTLGVDGSTGVIALNYQVELPLHDESQFAHIVAKAATLTSHWMDKVKTLAANHASADGNLNAEGMIKA